MALSMTFSHKYRIRDFYEFLSECSAFFFVHKVAENNGKFKVRK